MTEHTNDLDAIETRAKAATPGPWFLDGGGDRGVFTEPRASGTSLDVANAFHRTDEEHIAGMDPEQTLSLVAEVRELRAKVARVEADRQRWMQKWKKRGKQMHQLRKERDHYHQDAIESAALLDGRAMQALVDRRAALAGDA